VIDVIEIPALLSGDVVVLSAPPTDAALALVTENEAAVVAKAIDKRKREFATGRALARAGLLRLGAEESEIPTAPDRAPVWPGGIAGSISHCDTRAVVAVRRREHGTVGVDVEHRTELKRELWKSVFTDGEVGALEERWRTRRGLMALVMFSAKESLYKAQYPWTSTFMGFQELVVDVEEESETRGVLRCTFQNDVGRFARGSVELGRYDLRAFPGGEIVTAVEIR
jgi:4'-phosphopantetheinyl transferase EntD